MSKVATELEAAIPTEVRVFALCLQQRMWQTHRIRPAMLRGLTVGQGGGCAQCPHGAGSPQLAARHGEVKHSRGKVCREAPQRRSHRHLPFASDSLCSRKCASPRRVRVEWKGGGQGEEKLNWLRFLLAFALHFSIVEPQLNLNTKHFPVERVLTTLGRFQKNQSVKNLID